MKKWRNINTCNLNIFFIIILFFKIPIVFFIEIAPTSHLRHEVRCMMHNLYYIEFKDSLSTPYDLR